MPIAIWIKGEFFLKIRVADHFNADPSFHFNADGWSCRPVVADSHHFDYEQDLDPDWHLSEKSDLASHKSDAILLSMVCRPSKAPF